jgi:hypothetical protein
MVAELLLLRRTVATSESLLSLGNPSISFILRIQRDHFAGAACCVRATKRFPMTSLI